MSTYTVFFFKARLRNLPEEILSDLKDIMWNGKIPVGIKNDLPGYDDDTYFNPRTEHPFFKSRNILALLLDEESEGLSVIDKETVELDLSADFKCYDCETEKLFDLVSPFISEVDDPEEWFAFETTEGTNLYTEYYFRNGKVEKLTIPEA